MEKECEVRIRTRDKKNVETVEKALKEFFQFVVDNGGKQEHNSDVWRQYYICEGEKR